MKFHRHVMTWAAAVFLLQASPAFALEQLPLPETPRNIAEVQIAQFVAPRALNAGPCINLLQNDNKETDRIRAIKAYRECRAEHALQQLAAGRWQDGTQNPN